MLGGENGAARVCACVRLCLRVPLLVRALACVGCPCGSECMQQRTEPHTQPKPALTTGGRTTREKCSARGTEAFWKGFVVRFGWFWRFRRFPASGARLLCVPIQNRGSAAGRSQKLRFCKRNPRVRCSPRVAPANSQAQILQVQPTGALQPTGGSRKQPSPDFASATHGRTAAHGWLTETVIAVGQCGRRVPRGASQKPPSIGGRRRPKL